VAERRERTRRAARIIQLMRMLWEGDGEEGEYEGSKIGNECCRVEGE
jgi:hypothetical protein